MAYIKDGKPCNYFPLDTGGYLVAIGWLDHGFEFRTGIIDKKVYKRIVEFRSQANSLDLGLPVNAGHHNCTLCQFDGESSWSHIIVPCQGKLFIAPEAITHYIAVYRYLPSDEFISAIMDCPLPKTMEYKRMVLDNGGREIMKLTKQQNNNF